MPLAFTQEDFLVFVFCFFWSGNVHWLRKAILVKLNSSSLQIERTSRVCPFSRFHTFSRIFLIKNHKIAGFIQEYCDFSRFSRYPGRVGTLLHTDQDQIDYIFH